MIALNAQRLPEQALRLRRIPAIRSTFGENDGKPCAVQRSRRIAAHPLSRRLQ